MAPVSNVHDLLHRLGSPFTGEILFDHLADIVFFIKNAAGQYLTVNNTLVERCGLRHKSQLLGRTASQVFRPPLGDRFEHQDREVAREGRPLLMQLELHVYPTQDVGWCLTSKLPLLDASGDVIGLVGVSQDVRLPDASLEEYHHVAAAVAFAEMNLSTHPSVDQMARIAGMSRYQLDRRMRRVYGLTTGQWLLKLRIDFARRRLRDGREAIADVALQSGYADQSAFTRQFRRTTGLTPREYRESGRGESRKPARDELRGSLHDSNESQAGLLRQATTPTPLSQKEVIGSETAWRDEESSDNL